MRHSVTLGDTVFKNSEFTTLLAIIAYAIATPLIVAPVRSNRLEQTARLVPGIDVEPLDPAGSTLPLIPSL
ncbi:MAG: hypothetical protein ACI9KN_000132 [Gammaproteobacteria bacterium]|jgi:hypothetical protein